MAAMVMIVAANAHPAAAETRTPAKVRYETRSGSSQWYDMEVVFVRGAELNRATRTYDYGHFDAFAVLFFGQGQAAVIELEGMFFGCPTEFTAGCLPSYGNMEGADQDGTKWEICAQRYCF